MPEDLPFIEELIDKLWPMQRFGLGQADEHVAKLNKAIVAFIGELNEYKKYCEGK